MSNVISRFSLMTKSTSVPVVATQPVLSGTTQVTPKGTPAAARTAKFVIGNSDPQIGHKGGHFRVVSTSDGTVINDNNTLFWTSGIPVGQINPADYEIRMVPFNATGTPNYTLGGLAHNTWHTLSDVQGQSFDFIMGVGRYGAFIRVDVTVRHKVQTTLTATLRYTVRQDSDVVAPTWTGPQAISDILFHGEVSGQFGVFVNVDYPNDGTAGIEYNVDGVNKQAIPIGWILNSDSGFPNTDSEYEMAVVSTVIANPAALASTGLPGNYYALTTLRGNASKVGWTVSGAPSSPATTATMTIRLRHKTDTFKFTDRVFSIAKNLNEPAPSFIHVSNTQYSGQFNAFAWPANGTDTVQMEFDPMTGAADPYLARMFIDTGYQNGESVFSYFAAGSSFAASEFDCQLLRTSLSQYDTLNPSNINLLAAGSSTQWGVWTPLTSAHYRWSGAGRGGCKHTLNFQLRHNATGVIISKTLIMDVRGPGYSPGV